jgi:hypothetical protein
MEVQEVTAVMEQEEQEVAIRFQVRLLTNRFTMVEAVAMEIMMKAAAVAAAQAMQKTVIMEIMEVTELIMEVQEEILVVALEDSAAMMEPGVMVHLMAVAVALPEMMEAVAVMEAMGQLF